MQKTPDFWVGDRVVRPSLGEIRLGIERVRLEPRSMQVLLALANRPREVVSKQELIDEVWGEKFVSDEVLTHAIWDLRRAFGDQASNPEFIQTIPKRGYRLIAPVKNFEPAGEPEHAPAPTFLPSRVLLGILAVTLLGAAAVQIGRWQAATESADPALPPAVERAGLSGRRPEQTELTLTLTPANPAGSTAIPTAALDELRTALAELPAGIKVRKSDVCGAPPGGGNEYCLTPRLHVRDNGYRASVQVEDTASSRLVYAASVDLADLSDLETAGAELAELVSTYLEIVRTWNVRDPDIRPWISFRRHDVRAIRDFLLGRALVLTHEVGARRPFQTAIEVDPEFVAPRVWRTPTLAFEGDEQLVAAHLEGLQALYDEASPFEKTMISWAEAVLEGDSSEQLRHLKHALEQQPDNRPVRVTLAATLNSMGDPSATWSVLEPLLQETWCYPPLYPLAARCALDQDRIEEAQRALELALQCQPVTPESLGLLVLLAVFNEDPEAEAAYAERLERRTIEMLPEVVEDARSGPAGQLALRAQSEGRPEIAARLREFTN